MLPRPPCLPFLSPIGLRGEVSRSAASTVVNLSRLIGCGSFSLRPACSIHAVLALEASRPPLADAVFGREQSNSTDGTFTRLGTSFTGAQLQGWPYLIFDSFAFASIIESIFC